MPPRVNWTPFLVPFWTPNLLVLLGFPRPEGDFGPVLWVCEFICGQRLRSTFALVFEFIWAGFLNGRGRLDFVSLENGQVPTTSSTDCSMPALLKS